MICEGGGLSVDGEGTLITTESVMLNANRYLGRTQSDVESFLRDYLGAEKVIWLLGGLVEDKETDGHVDNLVEYIAPGVVPAQTVRDQSNPNREACRENLRRLRAARDARGRELVGVPSTVIAHEGGGVGCVTKEQPRGPLATAS
jgi:agmatine deiminase